MRSFLQRVVVAGVVSCLVSTLLIAADVKPKSPHVRAFQFTYAATVADLKPGQTARIWLPVPPSNDEQEVEIIAKELPVEGRMGTARPNGNRMLYLAARANEKGEIPIRKVYRVKRRELTHDKPVNPLIS
jgi:hypothetical protein